jgi:hypothetical protein
MRQLLNWFRETYSKPATGPKAGIWQGILHLAAVYAIARICTPWLIELTHNMILPLLTGRAARISPQFLYSHLFTFSFVPGLIAGFLNAKLFNHGIVRYVWVIPVVLLFVTFVFFGPGMYPTMILESNFKEAVHFFFGGHFNIPEYSTYSELQQDWSNNIREILRGNAQLRHTVPAYVGVAYSLGAWFSLYLSGVHASSSKVQKSCANSR